MSSSISFFVRWNKETISLRLEGDLFINKIKQIIQEKKGIPSHLQCLRKFNGRVLEDGARLSDQIPDQSTILLVCRCQWNDEPELESELESRAGARVGVGKVKSRCITVVTFKDRFTVNVSSSETPMQIIEKVCDQMTEKFFCYEQRLIKNNATLDDCDPLFHHIHDGDVLQLRFLPMTIRIKPDKGDELNIPNVFPTNTIADVKHKIAAIHKKSLCLYPCQLMLFGNILDDHCALHHYGIRARFTLKLCTDHGIDTFPSGSYQLHFNTENVKCSHCSDVITAGDGIKLIDCPHTLCK